MDGSNKTITVSFKTNEQDLQRLKTSIRDITADVAKLVQTINGLNLGGGRGTGVTMGTGGPVGGQTAAKAFAGPQGGGGSGGGNGLAQAFLDSSKAMKDMANVSRDSLRVMSDSVRRAIDEQKRHLAGLDKDLTNIIRRYDELSEQEKTATQFGGKFTGGGALQQAGGQVLQTVGQQQVAQQQLAQLQAQQQQIIAAQAPPPPGGGAPGAGGPGGPGGFFGVPKWMGGGAGWGKAALGVGAAIMGVANFGLDEAIAGTKSYATAEQRRAALVRPQMQALMSGDYRMSYAARTLDTQAKEDLLAQSAGTAAQLGQARSGVGQFFGSVPVIGGIGRAVGLIGPDQGGGALGSFNRATQQSNLLEASAEQIKAKADAQIMEGFAQEQFRSTLGSRISAQRILGLGGLGDIRTRASKIPGKTVREASDDYSDLQTSLMRQGYDTGEYASAFQGLRGAAGSQFAGKNTFAAMSAAAAGYGGFGDLLALGGRAGAGNKFGYGAIGGGIDVSAGMQLGQAILGSGFDVRGTTSGLGTLGAIQAGMGFTGGVGDFQKVSQVAAGLQLGNQVVGGGLDAYQQGRNLVSAIGVKPGADVYTQDYLATGMNTRQMMDAIRGGQLTETAKALGLTSGDIRKQMGSSISSVLEERLPGVDASSPMGKALAKYQSSGKDLPAYLSGLKGKEKESAIKTLGAAYGLATGEGEEAGIGLLGAEAGLDSTQALKLSKGLGKKVTGVEAADLEARAEKFKKVADELLRISEPLKDAIKGSTGDFTKWQKIGENLDAEASRFIAALGRMTDVLEKKFPGGTNAASARAPITPHERIMP